MSRRRLTIVDIISHIDGEIELIDKSLEGNSPDGGHDIRIIKNNLTSLKAWIYDKYQKGVETDGHD